jgi:hypothetical protein
VLSINSCSGASHQQARPTQLHNVERSNVTPWRAKICDWRYSGRWSLYLPISTCASRASVAMPPSIGRSGAGAWTIAPGKLESHSAAGGSPAPAVERGRSRASRHCLRQSDAVRHRNKGRLCRRHRRRPRPAADAPATRRGCAVPARHDAPRHSPRAPAATWPPTWPSARPLAAGPRRRAARTGGRTDCAAARRSAVASRAISASAARRINCNVAGSSGRSVGAVNTQGRWIIVANRCQ